MYCTYCGNPIPDEMRFCPNCGTPVKTVQTPPNEQNQAAACSCSPYARPKQGDQQVYVPIVDWQTPMEPAQPVQMMEQTPIEPQKQQPKLWIPIVAAVGAVIVAVVSFLLLGFKTEYLMTSQVIQDGSREEEWVYAYDAKGRITRYEYVDDFERALRIDYQYDVSGNLKKAVIRNYDSKTTVNYTYKRGKLQGCTVELPEGKDTQVDVYCNQDGTIRSVEYFIDGRAEQIWAFQYHDNGLIKTSTREMMGYSNSKTVMHYDDQGRKTEHINYLNSNEINRVVYRYDDKGHLLQEKTSYEGQVVSDLQYRYTYKRNKLQSMTIEFAFNDQKETVEFACAWKGRVCTMTVKEYDGTGKIVKDDLDTIEIQFEIDRAGNVLHYDVEADGETVMHMETEYKKIRVSRKYRKPDPENDPLYMFLVGNS